MALTLPQIDTNLAANGTNLAANGTDLAANGTNLAANSTNLAANGTNLAANSTNLAAKVDITLQQTELVTVHDLISSLVRAGTARSSFSRLHGILPELGLCGWPDVNIQ